MADVAIQPEEIRMFLHIGKEILGQDAMVDIGVGVVNACDQSKPMVGAFVSAGAGFVAYKTVELITRVIKAEGEDPLAPPSWAKALYEGLGVSLKKAEPASSLIVS